MAFRLMDIAIDSNHHEFLYYLNYIKLFGVNDKIRDDGIQGLAKLKEDHEGMSYVVSCKWH